MSSPPKRGRKSGRPVVDAAEKENVQPMDVDAAMGDDADDMFYDEEGECIEILVVSIVHWMKYISFV